MAYEVVMLDLGGVTVEVESDRLVLQVSQLLGLSFDEVQAAVYHKDLLLPLELGQIKPETYFQQLKERLKLPWTYDQFVKSWNGIFKENEYVTDLMQRLRRRHKLLALSNTNALHLEYIKTSFPSLAVFEYWVASCDVGYRKPDPQIYLLAAERAGVRPSQAIYIDDRPELVEAGRGAGLTAIRFEDGPQLEQELRAAGINV